MAAMFLPLPIERQALYFILFAVATPIQFWACRQFYAAAWATARHGSTNMSTLVAVGTTAAYAVATNSLRLRAYVPPRDARVCTARRPVRGTV
jgi:Cu+-exporting ATPase